MCKIIACCVQSTPYLDNQIFDPSVAAKYPGAEGASVLADIARQNGYEIVTGDVALKNVKMGKWDAKDVVVVQDMDCQYGLELIDLGADARVLGCFESPIFAYPFYDNLPNLASRFKHRMLFGCAMDLIQSIPGQNHQVYFPIFHKDQLPPAGNWSDKKYMGLVAGNKHYRTTMEFPSSLSFGKIKRWLKKTHQLRASQALSNAIKNELQTKRLEAVEHFGAQSKLEVHGRYWDDLQRMPAKWRPRLKDIVEKLNPHECENKVDTLSQYKFAICFENISCKGYVTEKIIDALVAAAIPIYMGAPDITDFVPKEVFVDLRDFDSWQSLQQHLDSITAEQANETIAAGRAFLNSPQGQRHTFQSYAQTVLDFIREIDRS